MEFGERERKMGMRMGKNAILMGDPDADLVIFPLTCRRDQEKCRI